MVGNRIVVKPIFASAAPADMSLTLIDIASNRLTFFRSPVASLTKTGAFPGDDLEAIVSNDARLIVFNIKPRLVSAA